jgi:hypothetical protein
MSRLCRFPRWKRAPISLYGARSYAPARRRGRVGQVGLMATPYSHLTTKILFSKMVFVMSFATS